MIIPDEEIKIIRLIPQTFEENKDIEAIPVTTLFPLNVPKENQEKIEDVFPLVTIFIFKKNGTRSFK